jgi:CheY-like chemotaxis protein
MEPLTLQRAPQSAPSQAKPNHFTPAPRILVVDDDPMLQDIFSMLLRLENYETETASDGQVALELLRARHFDLVLTDRNMPRMGGVGLIREIIARDMDVPIVMISGSLDGSPLPPDVAWRVAVALPKPALAAQILAAVAFALHPDPAERRVFARTRETDLLQVA